MVGSQESSGHERMPLQKVLQETALGESIEVKAKAVSTDYLYTAGLPVHDCTPERTERQKEKADAGEERRSRAGGGRAGSHTQGSSWHTYMSVVGERSSSSLGDLERLRERALSRRE